MIHLPTLKGSFPVNEREGEKEFTEVFQIFVYIYGINAFKKGFQSKIDKKNCCCCKQFL